MENIWTSKKIFLTLSEDSRSEKCSMSSTAQEDVKLEASGVVIFMGICCLSWLGGSKQLFAVSLLQLEFRATRIPVARYRWWFAERLPAEWMGSSQSWQNMALSSTQKMKAALSCFIKRNEREKGMSAITSRKPEIFYNTEHHYREYPPTTLRGDNS